MSIPKRFLLSLLCLSGLLIHAQQVPYQKYTSKNGLISDRITSIAQDEKGFMWFGSYFGICRYDGIRFEKISLPPAQQNKYVSCLLATANKIYAGFLFGGGLAEYANGKVNAYFIKGPDSASSNDFICMTPDGNGGILLCNSAAQVYQFKNGAFTHLHSLKQVKNAFPRSIQKDRNNHIWISTDKGLVVLSFPYQSEHVYFAQENLFSLVKDQQEKIWFGRTRGATTVVQTSDGWKDGKLLNARVAQTGSIFAVPFWGNTSQGYWSLSPSSGLICVNASGEQKKYQLPLDYSTETNLVFADREHNLWIANEPGIFKVSNFDIRSYRFQEVAAAGGALCQENDSVLWASNSKAVYRITNEAIQKIQFPLQQPDYYGLLYLDALKQLWVGLWNGGIWSARWKKGKWQSLFFPSFKKQAIKAQCMEEDGEGNTWIAGSNGIFLLKNNSIIERIHPKNAAGQPAFITCMALDKKNHILWLGDNATGIIRLRYDGRNRPFLKDTMTDYLTEKEGLKDPYVRSMALDEMGTLWVGCRYGGIYRIQETSKGFNVENCNAAAHISCTRITDIKKEDTTAVWFASCNGIYRYLPAKNQWRHYNTSHGLLNAEVFSIAVDAKKKLVWALTAEGITKLPIDAQWTTVPPQVNITSVNVLGKPDSLALATEAPVQFPFSKNSIGFSFAGASFIDEKRTLYKYRLEGYDQSWSEPVTTNSVNYASLPAGHYEFKVLASNVYGQWSAKPASFRFEIVRPFYNSPVFMGLLVFLALAAFYFIRLQHLQQRYRIEKLRLTIARDLHDDVGSTLGSINLLTETASRRLTTHAASEEIVPLFQKIGQSAETTLDAMDDIVWSINPGKDKIQDLLVRMREFAIPLLEARNIGFNFIVEGADEQPLPMNLRRNAFLIFKETIYNVLKHAEATRIEIKISRDHHLFLMQIADNGKGFSAPSGNRNGLQNLHSRAEMVQGALTIHSSAAGTQVQLTAPLR